MFRRRDEKGEEIPVAPLPDPRCPYSVESKTDLQDGIDFLPRVINGPSKSDYGDNDIRFNWNIFGKALVKVPIGATNIRIEPITTKNGGVEGYWVTYNFQNGMARLTKFGNSWTHEEVDEYKRTLRVNMYVTEVETTTS